MPPKNKKRPRAESKPRVDKDLEALVAQYAAAGKITIKAAREIWVAACDGPGVQQSEFRVMEAALTKYTFTHAAKKFMKEKVSVQKSGKSFYKQEAGKKFDRQALDLAAHLTKDGKIALEDAKLIWKEVSDGGRVTDIEAATVRKILTDNKCTKGAKKFLEAQLDGRGESSTPVEAKKPEPTPERGESSTPVEAKKPEPTPEPEAPKPVARQEQKQPAAQMHVEEMSSSSSDSDDNDNEGDNKMDTSDTNQETDNSDDSDSDSSDDSSDSDSGSDSEDEYADLKLQFRNYNPRDKELAKKRLPRPSLDKELRWADTLLNDIRTSTAAEQDVLNVAPKKANWDLKRDIQARLDEANRQTQLAIVDLIQEKLKRQEEEGSDSGSDSSSGSSDSGSDSDSD